MRDIVAMCLIFTAQIKHNGWSYFTSFFSILDLLIIASALCCISFGIHQAVNVEKSLRNIFDEPNKHVSLAKVGYWQMVFNSTLAVTLFLAWLKVLHIAVLPSHCCCCCCDKPVSQCLYVKADAPKKWGIHTVPKYADVLLPTLGMTEVNVQLSPPHCHNVDRLDT